MNILIAVTTDVAYDQRMLRIAGSLATHGHQVTVIGRNKGIQHKLSTPFQIKLIDCWFSKSFLFYAEYNLRLFFLFLSARCDLICACDLDTLLASTAAAVIKNKKLVFDAHEYFEESIEIVNKNFIKGIWQGIARLCIPKASLRYTVSNSLARELSNKYKQPFSVIRNVPVSSFPALKANRQKMIWYQGAINEGRGLECMVECMLHLEGYSFYLAGEGDIVMKLRQLVKSLGLERRVHFLGRLTNIEMKDYSALAFAGIDLLESSSKSYYYSLSNKTFDYIHAILPSIQMNFPEYHAIHSQYTTGVLIERVDRESILAGIRQLETEEYYEQCVEACIQAAKIYNWEEEEKTLIGLYKQLNK
jgi:glycosyltransferase involved in cell wall biosynthesis